MKLEVFRLAVILKAIVLIMPCFAGDLIRETTLDWTHTISDPNSETLFKFRRVQFIRGFLKFEVMAHNLHKTRYQCLFITATKDTIHMDDQFGHQYSGATVTFEGDLDNKLALNQIKLFTISIPAPREDVGSVNLHFGLFSRKGSDKSKCHNPLGNRGYNFHKLNWDVSRIR
jgi:hypothetical protein